MYITRVPNRNSPPAILLRESYRDNGKVKSRTLANLSKLPPDAIAVLRRSLKGEQLVAASDAFEAIASRHHGHVRAGLLAMRRLRFAELIASRASRQRDRVVAMVLARILEPDSKLATTRWWHITTLPPSVGWPMPMRTTSTKPSTGCSNAKSVSSASSQHATSTMMHWRSTT